MLCSQTQRHERSKNDGAVAQGDRLRTLRVHPATDGALSQKGEQTILKILSAARDIFIENGYGAFNLKRVSERCGLARGNVTYYFPNRDALLQALLRAVISGYTWDFDHIMADASTSAEEKFVAIVRLIVEDLGTRETSIFFPELWALASRSDYAAAEMEDLYADARRYFVDLIAEINPGLGPDARQAVALFCSAALEGQTPFVGHGRVHGPRLRQVANIAAEALLATVQRMDPALVGRPRR